MSLHCTWRDIMREAAERLRSTGVENAARDVRLLMAQALGVEPVDVILRETDAVDPLALTAFEALISRRAAGEPVSRIRGWREFYGRRFAITPDVLDPRPETELLVGEGVKRLRRGGRVADLGVGSGCILLSVLAERPDASGVGIDISAAALAVAQSNARALGLERRADFVEAGWEGGTAGAFDLVLSNPPYIAADDMPGLARDVMSYDPHLALSPGGDGLAAYRAILARASHWLAPGGSLGFEFGLGQADAVAAMMWKAGLTAVEVYPDLAGIPRAAFGRRPAEAP